MKIGIRLNIDVTKLDKTAFYKGEKGTYCTMTAFVDTDEEDKYGNNGMITQDLGKERRDEKGPILGNSKVFWKEESKPVNAVPDTFDEDIDFPF